MRRNEVSDYGLFWPGKEEAKQEAFTPTSLSFSSSFSLDDNVFITGDNLDALKLLQEQYTSKVKMIYIDPPYNTGKKFNYNDNFSYSKREWLKLYPNTSLYGRFHTKWLSMMYPRLYVARNLLRDDGVIFISIGDHEVANLRKLCDEVFGEENFVAQVTWKRKRESSNDSRGFAVKGEYILVYSKSEHAVIKPLPLSQEYIKSSYNEPTKEFFVGKWRPVPIAITKGHKGGGYLYQIITPTGKNIEREWAYPEERYKELLLKGRIYFGKSGDGIPQRVVYEHEMAGVPPSNVWDDVATNKEGKNELVKLMKEDVFDTVKPTLLVKRMLQIATSFNTSDIVLDFFAGSATTAHAVLDLNKQDGGDRKFILVQLPEPCAPESEAYKAGYKTIADIGKERIRRVIKKLDTKDTFKDVYLCGEAQ